MIIDEVIEKELRLNFEAFEAALSGLSQVQRDMHALLRHGKIEGFYDTAGDAHRAGQRLYSDKLFSIQQGRDVFPGFSLNSHAIYSQQI